jgi:cell shape-determining protein MreC
MNVTEGVWLPINDYSRYKDVSVSTIRRHIKNNILKYKEENGKYLIYVPSTEKLKLREEAGELKLKLELELLRTQIKALKEENNELKMLVDLYEKGSQINSRVFTETPPDLPVGL